ncbi:MAG: cell filamentation protein Fic [Candidatus Pacebacteria bacterium CG_4_10_14_3_um_filter_34_15]|nr:Fic family protein [Candidatus Paceibacterota bacterium]NCS86981.1 Fic family protein [Candidatus Paceibacterota bacterium]OIO44537.1 MAG: cell filamentation protein Fic [Candidatus Pacebacteria bacterium CG1_02_43_31]PIQ80822.1 MAG: cell filamentation protein Fic [Candidatus Pacebacteria bacterium CG11_big_fil_rev_8_21_14_0_20_34_55]PIX81484.1 MAG: cell filamentation protein Fic [Candidatus Pacebacteria bacterium CG_4_10_14_3_um_filter_34_15]
MPYLQPALANRIDQKLKKLQSLRPLPPSAVRKLKEQFEIEMTYNSNAIEGNSLTLKETYLVIHEGLTIKGKPLKDHLEAKDHHEALEFLYEIVQHDSHPTLSEHLIRTLHQLVMKKTDEEFAGKYRNSNVFIGGADHIPPDALLVPAEMKKLMNWFVREIKHLHSIELASLLHHKLVYIHPFFDGNGRTSRLSMNIVLMKSGYPLVLILKNDRKKYYQALEKADKGNYIALVKFIAQAVERSLDIYLKTLTPSSEKREKFLLLSEISSKTPYSTKYLNLLARQGKLEAHKQGRNWLTTTEAVERYIERRERIRKLN